MLCGIGGQGLKTADLTGHTGVFVNRIQLKIVFGRIYAEMRISILILKVGLWQNEGMNIVENHSRDCRLDRWFIEITSASDTFSVVAICAT